MARADFYTWLPLDRFAQIFGIHPLHFNQMISRSLQDSVCGKVWFQYAWQSGQRISREDIAIAIQNAEQLLMNDVGYALLPSWFEAEEINTIRPANPLAYSTGLNLRGEPKTVFAKYGYMIAGGVQDKTIVQAGVAVVRSDADGDGYEETVTVTVPTSVTDVNEIRVYYPGTNGADIWEIRPIQVSISGGNAVITFKSWQIVEDTYMEKIDAEELDADVAANYERTVDVYRVYHDPSTQLTIAWNNIGSCEGCGNEAQTGCITVRNSRLGEFMYRPGTWDAAEGSFTSAEYVAGRDPDLLFAYYLAGWRNQGVARPYVELDPFWERTIAYLAASLIDKYPCECANVEKAFEHWREPLNENTDQRSFQLSQDQLSSKFGATRGGVYAMRACQAPNRRIGR